jgi:hypothetical protein
MPAGPPAGVGKLVDDHEVRVLHPLNEQLRYPVTPADLRHRSSIVVDQVD